MANSKTYRIDPNIFNQASGTGVAELPADGSSANTTWPKLLANANSLFSYESVDTTATALALDVYESKLTVSGTMAFTLAAPTYAKQRKKIFCVSAASSPLATLTITSPDDTAGFVCSTTFIFNHASQSIELEATSALKWRCTRVDRSGSLTVVVGTDVLTGFNLNRNYSLSVTGTAASTGTKGLPNGSAVGERCSLTNSLAACIPVGSIDGTFLGMISDTAYTHIGAIGVVASTTVVGDCALLEWNGAAWLVTYQNGCTLS